MSKKKKLKLEGLKVKSFVTLLNKKSREVRGGEQNTKPFDLCDPTDQSCETCDESCVFGTCYVTCGTCDTEICNTCYTCGTCTCQYTCILPKCV
ncbi:MAG: hypothetical protein GTO45_01780 [Candidatus Aminicenantes bacterium]|nr:hypothetical protein [Candidatus Aminicenantes bacterium]NIM79767.1 hypothetical protein [Candidatus Aminicenantes bacterium]NIN16793.1 hypothetical protein [Candidatus Aminicenantes bacterium]NIN40647.1 hypothetical protein [Candidatus Aminicenantes bacterium]NIN83472.1 hypothetical protein [Candidatus Aminicenantes bacterium]